MQTPFRARDDTIDEIPSFRNVLIVINVEAHAAH